MTTGKTTKVADDLIVQAHKLELRKQAEIDGGWKRVLIPVQHMFPNCQVRYKTNCTDMKSCDKEVIGSVKVPSKEIPIEEIKIEIILHNVNGFKIDPKRDKIPKKPEGFEGW